MRVLIVLLDDFLEALYTNESSNKTGNFVGRHRLISLFKVSQF